MRPPKPRLPPVTLTIACRRSTAGARGRPGALLSGYTMTSWTLADGMPIGPVYAMAQDAEGYLWLGTTGGVVRFDGARFTPWNAIYPGPLPRGDVQALAWSRNGHALDRVRPARRRHHGRRAPRRQC